MSILVDFFHFKLILFATLMKNIIDDNSTGWKQKVRSYVNKINLKIATVSLERVLSQAGSH